MQLGAGATVHLEVAEDDSDRLDERLLADLFAVGLNVPEPIDPPQGPTFPRLTLDGNAQFLIGAYDVGTERGLEVVARGAHHVIEIGLRAWREPDPQPGDPEPTGPSRSGLSREESGILADNAEIVLDVEKADTSSPDMLEHVTLGGRVVLTEGGKRTAVLVSWRWYALQRERLARSAAAYWKASREGRLNDREYATEMLDVFAPNEGPPPAEGPTDGEEHSGKLC
ncbi:hypothetical protein AB6N24_06370 [Cellulomonas sp. 179-A 4D5 NHS]|uniref:hypothetical protein n=1 Tax=Cellulomonas sp. 179-A 4D5 NHS TaxID=3142378 RepID=UPI0039A1B9A3